MRIRGVPSVESLTSADADLAFQYPRIQSYYLTQLNKTALVCYLSPLFK